MKYALVLASTLSRVDWHCYLLVDTPQQIANLNCYQPTVIKLSKDLFPGTVDPTPVIKPSCATGNTSEFRMVAITNLNLSGTFNLS